AADCRPSAPHQGFTGTRQAVHSHSVTCGQQPAQSGSNPLHARHRNWDRNRHRIRGSFIIRPIEVTCDKYRDRFPIAIATPIPTPIPRVVVLRTSCHFNRARERRSLPGPHDQRPCFYPAIRTGPRRISRENPVEAFEVTDWECRPRRAPGA
ncbi:MAG: hypothetical protein H6Q05_1994, partial [Acidobacteria bacterium]|nr:hypothetical protein [Acidobacteriota bacterium]